MRVTPHPFAIGFHFWTVIGGVWACGRCGQNVREWLDLGGRSHLHIVKPRDWLRCSYRPRRHWIVDRDAADGLPKSLVWIGDF